jgi:hypothetical protein
MKVRVAPIEPHRDQIEAAYPLLEGMPPRKAKELCRLIYKAMIAHTPQTRRGGLTKNQRRVHEVITDAIDEDNLAPTLREIAARVGFKDHSSAFFTVKALVRKGILRRGPGHRDLTLLKRPEET